MKWEPVSAYLFLARMTTQPNILKIVVADDHLLFMEGLCSLLATQSDFEVIAKAANGKTVLHLINHNLPDVLILDLNMPIVDGEMVAKKVIERYQSIKILVLSMYNTAAMDKKLKEIGVHGCLPKDTCTDLLFKVIRDVANGKTYFASTKPVQETSNNFNATDIFLKKHKLTYRELEILKLIAQNYTSQEIAKKLFISMFTVDTHRKNMIYKLKVDKKNGLLQFALENKLF